MTNAVGSIGDAASKDRAIDGDAAPVDPMSAVTGHPAKAGYNVRGYVADCLDHGSDPVDLHRQLVALGYKSENADHIVQEALIAQLRLRNLADSIAGGPVTAERRRRSAGTWTMAIGAAVIVVGVFAAGAGLATRWGPLAAEVGVGLILLGAAMFARAGEATVVQEINDYRTRRGYRASKMDGRSPWRSGTEESPL